MDATNSHTFRGYTLDQLRAAFDLVADPTDWRAPIRANICAPSFGLVAAAVAFFTASELRVVAGQDSGWLTVAADGYRAGPAGP